MSSEDTQKMAQQKYSEADMYQGRADAARQEAQRLDMKAAQEKQTEVQQQIREAQQQQ